MKENFKKIMDQLEIESHKFEELSQSNKAYMILYEAIQKLLLTPGTPLSEKELSDKLNMSRTPIREALHRLENDGLVERKKNKGAFVKSFSKEDVRQIYEMAEGLEALAVYLAADRGKTKTLDELGEQIKKMEKADEENDFNKWMEADQDYHATIPHLCDNKYLVEISSNLYGQINLFRVTYLNSAGIISRSIEEHKKTYEAIRKGDGDLAREITQKHWERIREKTLNNIYSI
ncbi:MAG: GntR family transcriptional regulator [Halanaerobiaceae bacterium]